MVPARSALLPLNALIALSITADSEFRLYANEPLPSARRW